MLDLGSGVTLFVVFLLRLPPSSTPGGSSGGHSHQCSEHTVQRTPIMTEGFGSTLQWVCLVFRPYQHFQWCTRNSAKVEIAGRAWGQALYCGVYVTWTLCLLINRRITRSWEDSLFWEHPLCHIATPMLEQPMMKVLSLHRCTVNGVAHYGYHFTGLSLLRPMYYEFPESPEAYTFDTQVSRCSSSLLQYVSMQ